MNKFTKWIKDLLIPHAGNDHKPHFFREYMLFIVSILAVSLLGASFGGSIYVKNTNMTAAVLPAVLVDLTNKDRSSSGQTELVVSPVLEEAARMKAEDMVNNQYFAHHSPTGISPWYWMKESGYSFVYAGENLAIDFTESIDVEDAWMKSPAHKKNIIDPRFTEIGIAAKEGIFQGRKTIFVVQMFGRPAFTEKNIYNRTSSTEIPTEKLAQNNQDLVELDGLVKGESASENIPVNVLSESKEFIMVENTSNIESVGQVTSFNEYQTSNVSFSQKAIYKSPMYVDIIYKVMLYLAALAMILFVGLEFKRKHLKNVVYGIIVIMLIMGLSYLNKMLFMSPALF